MAAGQLSSFMYAFAKPAPDLFVIGLILQHRGEIVDSRLCQRLISVVDFQVVRSFMSSSFQLAFLLPCCPLNPAYLSTVSLTFVSLASRWPPRCQTFCHWKWATSCAHYAHHLLDASRLAANSQPRRIHPAIISAIVEH